MNCVYLSTLASHLHINLHAPKFISSVMLVLVPVCALPTVRAQENKSRPSELKPSELKPSELKTREAQPSEPQPSELPATARTDKRIPIENSLLKTLETTTVSAEVSGRIAELGVVEGQYIKAGQTLGKVNDRAANLQLQQIQTTMARARLKQKSDIELRLAESRKEVSKNELDRALAANTRIVDTFPTKEVERLKLVFQTSELEIERAIHDRQVGELEVRQTEDQFRAAQELVERHTIRSPVDGMVTIVHRRLGEWVETGKEVVQIVKLDRLRIEGFISVDAAVDVTSGCKSIVTLLHDKHSLKREATVSFVSPEVNPATGQVRVFLELPNADLSLRPGMKAEAQILLPSDGEL